MAATDVPPALTSTELRIAAMDLLAMREHSRKELHDKLGRRFGRSGRFGDSAASMLDAELERLAEEGLQSDQRFAESFVHSRLQRRQGPLRVRQEMLLRGIDGALIDAVLRDVDPGQWHTAAFDAAAGRFGTEPPTDRKEWARRARFLQGRGFHAGQIHAVLAEFGGTGDGIEDEPGNASS